MRWKAASDPSPADPAFGLPLPSIPAAASDGPMKSKYRSLIASEWVQAAPCFCKSVVVNGPMRVEVSAIGVSTYSRTVPPAASMAAFIRSALSMAIW